MEKNIADKNIDSVMKLILDYKNHIKAEGIDDEIYKWKLLSEFIGKPDVEAIDFEAEIKKLRFHNLLYYNATRVLNVMAKNKPEELRNCFKVLFDESKDLTQRIYYFNKETFKLYRKIEPETKQSHHQDERSIATYLTYHNPDKYTFYKDGYYKDFCNFLGITPKKTLEKYVHYLEIINELINDYLLKDEELLMLSKSLIPEGCFKDPNHTILVQDILYQSLDKTKPGCKYWIFQGNPKIYNVIDAVSDNALSTWSVKAHKDDIKAGDKVIIWVTGDAPGCYALCEVTSEVYEGLDDESEKKYYTAESTNELSTQVRIKITHNLASNPITKDYIDTNEELSNLKVGSQGTNFEATETEYKKLLELAEQPKSSFSKVISRYSKEEIEIYFNFLNEIIEKFNLEKNDERLVFGCSYNSLRFTIGQRYCWYLSSSNKRGQFAIMASDQISTVNGRFDGKTVRPYFNYFKEINFTNEDRKSIFNAIDAELKRTNKSSFRKFNDFDFENAVFDKTYLNETLEIKSSQMNHPLNTILYGPPGTGKTYHTILKAAQIIENRTINDYSEALNIFNKHIGERIEFITFHQNYSYEDFIQGLRPDVENDGNLSFERKDGVFKRIADRALKNLIEANKPNEVKRKFEDVFYEFIQPLSQGEVNEIEIPMKKVSFYITSIGHKSIEFRKNDGDSKHTLSIDTLHKMYNKSSNDLIIGGLQPYYNPILNTLLEKGKLKTELVKEQNYIIIIDEINRANISRVFGELITLIEPDKRSHGEIPLKCTLPSGEEFIVPSNLYIIGTMNTADKSIALLDIALRRRFEFEAMYPKYEIEGCIINDTDILKKINESIVKLKGYDFQIGHSYFMGTNYNRIDVMNKKVIPLLLEYFMNDEKEVKGILTNAGLTIVDGSWPLQIKE